MSSRLDSVRPFAWAWLTYTLVIFALAFVEWVPSGLYKEMDFRAIYVASMLARTDPSHLYDFPRQKQLQDALVEKMDTAIPGAHLAYEDVLFVPFSLLKYRAAYLLLILFNAVLIGLSFLAARKEFSTIIPVWQPRPGWILFCFMPTTITLAQGQDSLLLLLIVCLTWRFLDRSHYFAAGLVLANLLVKPHLAVLLALFLAVRYGWRMVAGFVTGGGLVAAICLPYWLHGGLRAWFNLLSHLSFVSGHDQAQQASMGVYRWAMPNIRGLLFLVLGRAVSSHVVFVLVGLVSAMVLVWSLSKVRKLSPRNGFAFSVIVTVLVSYNIESHDLIILLLPMVLMEMGANKVLASCRDWMMGLPIALLIFTPSMVPGAGFTLMLLPLLACAFLLSRTTQTLSRTAQTQSQMEETALA